MCKNPLEGLLKPGVLSPTLRISNLVGLRRAWECAVLTSSQVMLILLIQGTLLIHRHTDVRVLETVYVGWSPFVARTLLGPCTYIQNTLPRCLLWGFKDNLYLCLSGEPRTDHTASLDISFCTWQHKAWPRCALSYLALLKIYAVIFHNFLRLNWNQ